jgi:hypothetical protein
MNYGNQTEYKTNYDTMFTLAETYRNKLKSETKDWFRINFSDVKVGDFIIINFYPDSQRYIDELYPKFGKVCKIDSEVIPSNNIHSDITIERLTLVYSDNEINAAHPWCSFYGNSRGYCYDIYRLDDISLHPIPIVNVKENDDSYNMGVDYDPSGAYEKYDPEQNDYYESYYSDDCYESGYDSVS